MAEKKISALTAVTTPAGTDEFPVNQGGTTKKMTRDQIFESIATSATPTFFAASGSTSGISFTDANTVAFHISGSPAFKVGTQNAIYSLYADPASGGAFRYGNTTSSVPTLLPNRADTDNGIGSGALNTLNIINGGATTAAFSLGTAVTQVAIPVVSADDIGLGIEAASGQTANLLEINTNGGSGGDLFLVAADGTVTLVHGEVSVGADDSGGSGFKVLRVPN